jgi:hypothetical protein
MIALAAVTIPIDLTAGIDIEASIGKNKYQYYQYRSSNADTANVIINGASKPASASRRSNDIVITVKGRSNDDIDIYVSSKISQPTAINHEYRNETINAANKQLIIPNALPATYYYTGLATFNTTKT